MCEVITAITNYKTAGMQMNYLKHSISNNYGMCENRYHLNLKEKNAMHLRDTLY